MRNQERLSGVRRDVTESQVLREYRPSKFLRRCVSYRLFVSIRKRSLLYQSIEHLAIVLSGEEREGLTYQDNFFGMTRGKKLEWNFKPPVKEHRTD